MGVGPCPSIGRLPMILDPDPRFLALGALHSALGPLSGMVKNFSWDKNLRIVGLYNEKRRSGENQLFIQISPSEFLSPFFETSLRF